MSVFRRFLVVEAASETERSAFVLPLFSVFFPFIAATAFARWSGEWCP
jgi:hypothetical protein